MEAILDEDTCERDLDAADGNTEDVARWDEEIKGVINDIINNLF